MTGKLIGGAFSLGKHLAIFSYFEIFYLSKNNVVHAEELAQHLRPLAAALQRTKIRIPAST